MKTYYVQFTGYNPVGTLAIVVARSRPKAFEAFFEALPEDLYDINWDGKKQVKLEDFIEVDTHKTAANIILNGQY